MNRLALLVATWFGCGYFPWGPGTIGSLAAIVMAVLLHGFFHWGRLALALLIAVLLWPSIWASTRAARLVKDDDPGIVVVDEVLGQWVTLLGAAVQSWKTLVAGFVLFRLFDIWKPWPVRNFEKLPAGLGIVTDDIAAGFYAALILYIGGTFRFY